MHHLPTLVLSRATGKPTGGRPFLSRSHPLCSTTRACILNTRMLLCSRARICMRAETAPVSLYFVGVTFFYFPKKNETVGRGPVSPSTYPDSYGDFLHAPHTPLSRRLLSAMEHATVPIPTDLEPDQEAMLKELREGEPRVELSLRVKYTCTSFLRTSDTESSRSTERERGQCGCGCTPVLAHFRSL